MTKTNLAPVSQRAAILDSIRGIAIMGIFLNNINGFSGYGYLNDKYQDQLPTPRIDDLLDALQHIFIEGKFYSIFSLLFGIGFSIILSKQSNRNTLGVFYRRLFILLIIGFIHCFFIWDGDILLLYALIGMVLPLFRNCSDRTLLIWAGALILSPILFDLIKWAVQWSPGEFLFHKGQALDKKNGVPLDDSFALYLYNPGSGFKEWMNWGDAGFYYRYEYILSSNRIVKVLGMFLIGFYAGRKGIHLRLQEYKPLFRKLLLWGLVIGLPASVAMVYFDDDGKNIYKSAYGLFDTFFYAISVVPLCLAYVSGFCLILIRNPANRFMRWVAPVGRMALTNYLTQTALGIGLFYGVGFGLGGLKFGLTVIYPIAIAVFIFQILFSNWWFRYFNYGPVEWIWRQLTYGKRLPIRKKTGGAINVSD